METFNVNLDGLLINTTKGSLLKQVLSEAGVDIDLVCGGAGKCGKCRVQLVEGVTEPTSAERNILGTQEINEGVRLACLTEVHNNIKVELLFNRRSEHQILLTGEQRKTVIEPHIRKRYIEVEKPSREHAPADWQRIKTGLLQGYNYANFDVPLALLRELPKTLRSAEHQLTVVSHGSEIVGLEEKDTREKLLGMAIDIGTTTVVGYLMDLYSGQELIVVPTLNPQAEYGADVISRITLAGQEEGLEKLHFAVIKAINALLAEAVEKAEVRKEDIYAVSIAGNTCMHHLFLGIDPKNLALSPYIPAVSDPLTVNASDLNLNINKAGRVFLLPNIAGFVGSDTSAVLLAAEMDRSNDIKLMIDIGTNGEIALGSKEKVFACSTAAGPAFEGAQISCGMRGTSGAIDHVYFGEKLEYTVIGGAKPQGICGSALLDTASGLLESGIINNRGKLLSPDEITNPVGLRFQERVIEYEGSRAFVLVDGDSTAHKRPIVITQKDIRELQLAKGAIAAGIEILLETCGIGPSEVKEVLLAGAFGNYMDPHSACVIGLIPKELESRVKMIGNAAGTGAKLTLLSECEYRRVSAISASAKYVALGSYPRFTSIYTDSMFFK